MLAQVCFLDRSLSNSHLIRDASARKAIGPEAEPGLEDARPFNVQLICKEIEDRVIECNLRESRSMPIIFKTYNVNLFDIVTRALLGLGCYSVRMQPIDMDRVGCKVPN